MSTTIANFPTPVNTTDAGTVLVVGEAKYGVGNSTTTLLNPGATYTGTWEDVSNYAVVVFTAISDVDSATSGFKFQWSGDGINVDRTEVSSLIGGVQGRAFNLSVRGKYFRLVYVNGSNPQSVFRVRTDYHTVGSGLITRPIGGTITTDNFALITESIITGQRPDGTFAQARVDEDNQLLTSSAAAFPITSVGNSTTTPIAGGAEFVGTGDDVLKIVSIDIAVITDQPSVANGLTFEFSQDGVVWDYSESFTIHAGVGQWFSLAPRARYFRLRYQNGATTQGTFSVSTFFYAVNRSVYTQNLNTDVPPEKAVEVTRAVLAAQKTGARENPYINLQATSSGLLKTAIDTVILPNPGGAVVRQKRNTGPTTGTSIATSLTSNTILGNTIIVVVQQGQGTQGATYELFDSQSNLYTRAASVRITSVGETQVWYANSNGGPLTVHANDFTASNVLTMQVYEVAGLVFLGSALDKATANFAPAVTALTVGPAVPSKEKEFCLAVYSCSNTALITPGIGWTSDLSAAGFGCFSQIPSVAGSVIGTATASVPTDHIALLVTFFPSEATKPLAVDSEGRLLVKAQLLDSSGNAIAPGAATTSTVSQNTSVVTLTVANSVRKGLVIMNDISGGLLLVKFGSGASSSDFAVKLFPNDKVYLPFPVYTGQITGIWTTAGSGKARITEFI